MAQMKLEGGRTGQARTCVGVSLGWAAKLLALAGLVGLPAVAWGHDFTITETRLVLENDRFRVEMTCDLDALVLGVGPGHAPEELAERVASLSREEVDKRLDGLRRMFQRRVRVRFDGQAVPFGVDFPAPDEPAVAQESPAPGADPAAYPSFLGVRVQLQGTFPMESEAVTFWASRSFPPVHLTVARDRASDVGRPVRQLLTRGEESLPYPVSGPNPAPGTVRVAGQYLGLGFAHILPRGLDHILFVLGLYLLSPHWRPLLWQVSTFTLAHSLTLALSTYGALSLSPLWVEPLIALSIAYVAVENLFTQKLKTWRVGVVFAFGLLHGLGFAGVLTELGLPREEFLTSLLAFNLGVELGQLAVIGLAFLAVGWFRERSWYRLGIVVPASCLMALVGLYLATERVIGVGQEVVMSEVQPLTAVDEVEALIQTSKERPVFIFKHSLTCSISTAAWDEYRRFVEGLSNEDEVVCALVEIQKARHVSQQVAASTGVTHESPQAILLKDGEVIWHASHWDVTVDSLKKALTDPTPV